ncbi:MAG: hypothetical protein KatS3mg086_125 [Candidatus Dojkabacteria bacterium]|nr:MAG: hypothetical protein KatS3mg086_125 [Candidatus Dojkabacteria bacterium]
MPNRNFEPRPNKDLKQPDLPNTDQQKLKGVIDIIENSIQQHISSFNSRLDSIEIEEAEEFEFEEGEELLYDIKKIENLRDTLLDILENDFGKNIIINDINSLFVVLNNLKLSGSIHSIMSILEHLYKIFVQNEKRPLSMFIKPDKILNRFERSERPDQTRVVWSLKVEWKEGIYTVNEQ